MLVKKQDARILNGFQNLKDFNVAAKQYKFNCKWIKSFRDIMFISYRSESGWCGCFVQNASCYLSGTEEAQESGSFPW